MADIIDPVVPLSSPVTKTYSRSGVSPAAKQRENDAFDMMVTGGNTPKIDESYFKPTTVTQDSVELIDFSSPVVEKVLTPKTRRSSRLRTPLLK